MTPPERLSDTAPWRDWFERAMNSGAPIVDNASDRLWGPNGQPDDQPERPDGECGMCRGDGCAICRAVA